MALEPKVIDGRHAEIVIVDSDGVEHRANTIGAPGGYVADFVDAVGDLTPVPASFSFEIVNTSDGEVNGLFSLFGAAGPYSSWDSRALVPAESLVTLTSRLRKAGRRGRYVVLARDGRWICQRRNYGNARKIAERFGGVIVEGGGAFKERSVGTFDQDASGDIVFTGRRLELVPVP